MRLHQHRARYPATQRGAAREVSFEAAKNLGAVNVTANTAPAIDVTTIDSRTVITSQELARLPLARSAEAIAEKQKNQAEREFNRANAKTPDLAGIMASNKRAEGAGSTMLTGPQGVSQDALSLGKNTLLGS